MGLMRLNFSLVTSNPIAVYELRAYARQVPLWIRRVETIGVVAVTLLLCAYLIIRWLLERSSLPLAYIYQMINFHVSAYVQVVVGIVYVLVLLRCTTSGVSVSNRYKRQLRDDIFLTGISNRQIIFGQWYAALYQVRGWLVALGLVRISAAVVMTMEYQFNVYWNDIYNIISNGAVCCNSLHAYDFGFHPLQLPLAFIFGITLSGLEVWATIGIGILTGTWFRNGAIAWVAANTLRALPILIFSWFPTVNSPGTPYDLLVIRWYEYTWFAFVDGGTNAMLRLTIPIYFPYASSSQTSYLTRSLLAFLAAVHMLLLYGIGSYSLAYLRLRWLRGASSDENTVSPARKMAIKRPISVKNLFVASVALGICVLMLLGWGYSSRVTPEIGKTFYYNPAFLDRLQVTIGMVVGLTTLYTIITGVRYGHRYRLQSHARSISWHDAVRLSIITFKQLLGWGFGLAVLFMTAFGLLIVEHLMNFYHAQLYDCALATYKIICGYTHFGWQPTQWLLALFMAIVLAGAILFSSAILGVSVGMIFHSSAKAVVMAVIIRAAPILLGLLPPVAQTADYYSSILITRWNQDPIAIFADTGVSSLIGMAEPYWHTGHVSGLTNISYSVLPFTLVIYMLVIYSGCSLIAVEYQQRKCVNNTIDNFGSESSKVSRDARLFR